MQLRGLSGDQGTRLREGKSFSKLCHARFSSLCRRWNAVYLGACPQEGRTIPCAHNITYNPSLSLPPLSYNIPTTHPCHTLKNATKYWCKSYRGTLMYLLIGSTTSVPSPQLMKHTSTHNEFINAACKYMLMNSCTSIHYAHCLQELMNTCQSCHVTVTVNGMAVHYWEQETSVPNATLIH